MKNKSVQGLRALFAIGVILSHCYFLENYASSAQIFSRVLSKTAVVSFFFMISGFYTINLKQDIKFAKYLKQKIRRIYPLHLLILLVMFLLTILQHEFDFYSLKNIVTLVMNACLLQTWSFDLSVATSFNTVSWFLSSLLFCYVVSYWLLKWMNGSDKKWFYIYLLSVLLLCFKVFMAIDHPTDDVGYYYCYLFPLAGLTDFMFGMIIGHTIKKVNWRRDGVWTVLQAVALGFMVVTVLSKFYVFRNYSRAFLTIPATALIVFSFSKETKFSKSVLGNRLMVFIGDISFEIYLIHVLCMSLINKTGLTALISSSISPFAALILNIIICILVACIYKKLMGLISKEIGKTNLHGGKKNEQQNN